MTDIQVKITAIGKDALLADDDFLILFDEEVTDDLRTVSVIQELTAAQKQEFALKMGDQIVIDGQSYLIQALGEQVNQQLQTLGHTVLYFTQRPDSLPINGVYLDGVVPKIQIGSEIQYQQRG
ncbi:PTS glucitol/sorbitol transporter subunit IIA [Bombilactobacillus folatiphilus]|uniref:PTS glucitol/sorbitol transporter subunit IIA n=1 Tax=Bombilactobacillus folatiphilus TaxID=2923362 RepID=A0ABY4P873_9LACO|nr:PTS glucitol/sorbitol transporter subunit IIA [Bombilactobacillus folatiphilus]UQS81726.1 PTS glucitol/sorbitol transporter subunit IIA [Bombilactobacillus folatiphilus]